MLSGLLTPTAPTSFFCNNIDLLAKYRVVVDGITFFVLPCDESTVWKEMTDLLSIDKNDIKKLDTAGKLDYVLDLRSASRSLSHITVEEASPQGPGEEPQREPSRRRCARVRCRPSGRCLPAAADRRITEKNIRLPKCDPAQSPSASVRRALSLASPWEQEIRLPPSQVAGRANSSSSASSANWTPTTQMSPSRTTRGTGVRLSPLHGPSMQRARAELELSAVLAAHEADAVGVEGLVALPVQIDPMMRAAVLIAEHLPAPAHDDDGPGDFGAVLPNPHQLEAHSALARNVVQLADA